VTGQGAWPRRCPRQYGNDVELVDLLAQNYFGNTREGSLAGPIGAFIIASLIVVTILLIWNMNARVRRLPERFPGNEPPASEDVSESSESGQRSD
jgi:hypothetical protein